MKDELSSAELAILGLLAEAPRHGYEIERLIEERGLREWTEIGFSSIYFLLDRLAKRGLATAGAGGGKARRPFEITQEGRERLAAESLRAIAEPARTYPDLLLGMANWPLIESGEGARAFVERIAALRAEMERLEAARKAQRPLPVFVDAMFDYARAQLAADLAWTEQARKSLGSGMGKIDFRKVHKALYSPPAGEFVMVDVPKMHFVKIDGEGNPNTSTSYKTALEWLYSVSYAMKFAAKAALSRDYTVPPLEGLWWADDPASFQARRKDEWKWTMMIMVPDFVDRAMFEAAVAKAGKKLRETPPTLRLEPYEEGPCMQTLHIGSYDDEGPVLARLHDEVMPSSGLTFNGPHHEIYLSDPRRTAPEKLRTILRQPVKPS
jgi:DNA-binding PadR family transcriptional regulator